jgi:hypothetical protein
MLVILSRLLLSFYIRFLTRIREWGIYSRPDLSDYLGDNIVASAVCIGMGLLLSLPIIFIFRAIVYLESPGPIFYRQRRSGRNGSIGLIQKGMVRLVGPSGMIRDDYGSELSCGNGILVKCRSFGLF